MADKTPDIVIFGAGIAGLWIFNRLKHMGYDVLLLERESIGCGQTITSQGIIHSGLKYAFAGKLNKLAKSISAMPDLWRLALDGKGSVNLSAAKKSIYSQYMLIEPGVIGSLIKLITIKALSENVRELSQKEWPKEIKQTGFKGSVIYMNEPVLDISKILHALAEPYKNFIRKTDNTPPMEFLEKHNIKAKHIIFTGAKSNHNIAKNLNHNAGLKTQARPLLMGMIKPAPYPLYAHLVGASEKPVATITTHKTNDGKLAWYIGGNVAERKKEADPKDVYKAIKKSFAKYLPDVDLSNVEWAVVPIDRIEGKSGSKDWMPDTPTIHEAENIMYCWPTKLTFAPMLSDKILQRLEEKEIKPSNTETDWSFLPEATYTLAPWDKAQWIKDN